MNFIRCLVFVAGFLAAAPGRAEGELLCFETQPATGASRAVACSARALLYTSQLVDDAAQPAARQASSILARMKTLLRDAGYGEAEPLRLEWIVTREAAVADLHHAMATEFNGPSRPAVSLVQGRIGGPAGVIFALNGIYALPAATRPAQAGVRPVGPSRLAILPAGGTTYVSGQSEQGTNTLESARLTLASLMRTLDFLKLTRQDVVQFKIFLQPIADKKPVMAALDEIYAGKQSVPPVVFVEWLGQPSLEIEMVVASPPQPGAPSIEFLTPPGMTTSTVYSRIVRVNSPTRVFFSTLTAAAAGDGKAQVEDIFGQLGRLLTATGSSFEHLAKATYYVSDDAAGRALNELRPRFYHPRRPPAASRAAVRGTAVPGRTLALDMIAVPTP